MNTQSLRERLANFNNKQKNAGNSTTFEKARWYATDEHDIRFVPTVNKGTYYDCSELVCFRDSDNNILVVELLFHGNVTKFPFLCPAQFGDECAVCDYVKFLGRWKDDDGNDRPEAERKADFQIVKKIRRAPKYACNVVERGKESEGAFWFLISPGSQKDVTGFHKILEFCGNKIYRRMCGVDEKNELMVLFGLENGFDVHVSFQKAKNQDGKGNTTGYAAVVFQLKAEDVSPLAKTKPEREKLLNSVKSLETAYQRKTAAEVRELLEEFVSGKQEELKVGPQSSDQKFETNSNEIVANLPGDQAIDDELEKLLSNS